MPYFPSSAHCYDMFVTGQVNLFNDNFHAENLSHKWHSQVILYYRAKSRYLLGFGICVDDSFFDQPIQSRRRYMDPLLFMHRNFRSCHSFIHPPSFHQRMTFRS